MDISLFGLRRTSADQIRYPPVAVVRAALFFGMAELG